MIELGFRGAMTYLTISDVSRIEMKCFFHDLIKFLLIRCDVRHKLISDKLYKRYLKCDEINAAYDLMKALEKDFLAENNLTKALYIRYFMAFYEACNEYFFLKENDYPNSVKSRIQVSVVTTPYYIFEKLLPDKFYDDLPTEAGPYWMQTISMKEYVKKYSKDPEILALVEKW